MAKAQRDGIATVVREVEDIAKRLRADIRKRVSATGVPKELAAAAGKLRKRAAAAAAEVEKYVHQVRIELERGAKTAATSTKRAKPKARPAATSA